MVYYRILNIVPYAIQYYLVISESPYLTRSATGTSLVVQWLRLCDSTSGGVALITGWGTKIPHAKWCCQINK